MAPTTIALLVGASLFAGTVDAIAGGGGLVTLPALLAAGLPPHLALGTNKGQSVWGGGASLFAFARAGRVERVGSADPRSAAEGRRGGMVERVGSADPRSAAEGRRGGMVERVGSADPRSAAEGRRGGMVERVGSADPRSAAEGRRGGMVERVGSADPRSAAEGRRGGMVDVRVALATFPLGFAGAVLGATLVGFIAEAVLRPVIVGLLLAAAALIVVRKPGRADDAAISARRVVVRAAALALVVGGYDGFFGPGTGTFLIVGFVTLCGRSLVHASADAKVVNLASNLAALAVFARADRVVWEVALPMAAGQLCGGTLGAHLTLRGGERVVRIAVLVVSGALILKLVLQLVR